MTRILIIGNGFDLNLGLKTSYKDFLDSEAFRTLSNTNMFAKYLQHKNEIQHWVDVEHELKSYANGLNGNSSEFNEYLVSKHYNLDGNSAILSRDEFKKLFLDKLLTPSLSTLKASFKTEFTALKTALHKHLESELKSFNTRGTGKSNAFRLLRFGTLFDDTGSYHDFSFTESNFTEPIVEKTFDVVFTFNYTNPLPKIGYSRENGVEPYFIHGSLNQGNIVFGVEDGSVLDEFNFLLKSDHAAFGVAPDLLTTISGEPKEFHFFGCSLGDTDNAHFLDFFSSMAQTDNQLKVEADKHKLFFYVHGQSGYQHIRNRILHLTKRQLSRFKLNNKVVFYDIETNKMVDQNYLNQL